MEREFYRYLIKLDPDDRDNALTTFLHLLDDEELTELIERSQKEKSDRAKRASGSVKRSDSAANQNHSIQNQSSAGRDIFKRLRLSVDTSTPVRSEPNGSITTPYSLTRRKLPAAGTKPKDLLSELVRGQPDTPDEQKSDMTQNTTANIQADAYDEDEMWDDKYDEIIAAYDADRTSAETAVTAGTGADPGSGDYDPVAHQSDAAIATFVTGKFKKKTVPQSHTIPAEFQIIENGDQILSE
jgi:hypothetical protein